VVHSRDDQEVGVAHKVKSPASIFPNDNGTGKTKPSDQPKMLSKACHRILIFFYLTEFSTD